MHHPPLSKMFLCDLGQAIQLLKSKVGCAMLGASHGSFICSCKAVRDLMDAAKAREEAMKQRLSIYVCARCAKGYCVFLEGRERESRLHFTNLFCRRATLEVLLCLCDLQLTPATPRVRNVQHFIHSAIPP